MQYYVTDLCHGKRKEWGGILCYIISQGGSCKCARMLSVIYLCQGGGSKCGWNAKSVIYFWLCQEGGSKCGWNAKLRVLSTFGFAKGEVQGVGGLLSYSVTYPCQDGG